MKITNFSLYNAIAIKGQTGGTLTGNYGVAGEHLGGQTRGYLGGLGHGVLGEHTSSGHRGLLGASDQGVAGFSATDGTSGYLGGSQGARGGGANGNFGYLGGSDDGARGHHAASANYGSIGRADCGIYGRHTASGNHGSIGRADCGIYGWHGATSRYGMIGTENHGVYGNSGGSTGRNGYLGGYYGAYGEHPGSSTWGALGAVNGGVVGRSDASNYAAVWGRNANRETIGKLGTTYGVYGEKQSTGRWGYLGGLDYGVYGSDGTGDITGGLASAVCGAYGDVGYTHGRLGTELAGATGSTTWNGEGTFGALALKDGDQSYAVYGSHNGSFGSAGYFVGSVTIDGWLFKAGGSFLIDHPLDPENKLLRHNFVESPENLLIYRGKARLDASGEATIALPDYFAALTDEEGATITLTCIGRPFPLGSEWAEDHGAFRVFGDANREVAWVVYADRDDPVIRQAAGSVEEEKGPENRHCNRGELLYPAAYGYPETAGRGYAISQRARALQQSIPARPEGR